MKDKQGTGPQNEPQVERIRLWEFEQFQRAVELFNRGAYFEAHEQWEEIWSTATAETRVFLQSLIHLAVACHHLQSSNLPGCRGQLTKGLHKLSGFLPEFCQIRTDLLYESAKQLLDSLEKGDAGKKQIKLQITLR